MLNETQKAQCRLYLGFPDAFRYKNTRLESMLVNLSPEADVMIAALLAQLASLDESLFTSGVAGTGGVKKVDEIEFFPTTASGGGGGATAIRKAGRMYVGRLSIILGCPAYSDYFSGSGYAGDSFSGGMGSTRGGGYGLA